MMIFTIRVLKTKKKIPLLLKVQIKLLSKTKSTKSSITNSINGYLWVDCHRNYSEKRLKKMKFDLIFQKIDKDLLWSAIRSKILFIQICFFDIFLIKWTLYEFIHKK